MADKTVTYAVEIPVDTNAKEGASSVDDLRKALKSSQDAVKEYGAALRNLRGDSDAVKAAKDKLKGAIAANRDNVSKATQALVAQGASLKDSKSKTEGFATSVVNKLIPGLKDWSGAQVALVSGSVALVGAIVAVSAGIIAATVAMGKFILESGNALRTQNLFREAATGSAANAAAFGHQIEALASKVPQSREELQELSVTMSRALVDTRVSGEGIVDTFNAVAQASAAMGDAAGSKIQGLIERSKQFGRMGLGLQELQGTGLRFNDVAGQLAKDLHIGLQDAQNELIMGRVNVNAGAKALREVVETKFGGINVRRMFDLNVIATKFKDTVAGLTKDVNLEQFGKGLATITEQFSENTVTGQAMKHIITDFGETMGAVFTKSIPFVVTFVQSTVLEMLKLQGMALDTAIFIKEKFGVNITKTWDDASSSAKAATVVFDIMKYALYGLGAAAAIGIAVTFGPFVAGGALLYGAAMLIWEGLKLVGRGFVWLWDEAGKIVDQIKEVFTLGGWKGIGEAMLLGLVEGIKAGAGAVWDAVKAVGSGIKNAFTGVLDMHSPSKVFERYGDEGIGEGAVRGIQASKGRVQAAAGGLAPAPTFGGGGPAGGAKGGGGGMVFNINLHVTGGADGEKTAQAITSPSIRAQLIKFFEECAINGGLRPQKD